MQIGIAKPLSLCGPCDFAQGDDEEVSTLRSSRKRFCVTSSHSAGREAASQNPFRYVDPATSRRVTRSLENSAAWVYRFSYDNLSPIALCLIALFSGDSSEFVPRIPSPFAVNFHHQYPLTPALRPDRPPLA